MRPRSTPSQRQAFHNDWFPQDASRKPALRWYDVRPEFAVNIVLAASWIAVVLLVIR
jgi:hypothetical protein